MQPEVQTTTRDSLVVSVGVLEIAYVIQGTLEVFRFYLVTIIAIVCSTNVLFA